MITREKVRNMAIFHDTRAAIRRITEVNDYDELHYLLPQQLQQALQLLPPGTLLDAVNREIAHRKGADNAR